MSDNVQTESPTTPEVITETPVAPESSSESSTTPTPSNNDRGNRGDNRRGGGDRK